MFRLSLAVSMLAMVFLSFSDILFAKGICLGKGNRPEHNVTLDFRRV